MGSTLRRRANLTWDIEGQNQTIYHHRHLPATPVFLSLPIFPFISKVCTYKKRVVGLFFLLLETASAVLDGIGKNKLDFLLVAFVLSAIGFVFTLYACIKRRAKSASTTEVPAERQLRVVELVFSSIQLIASLIQFLLAHLKENKILDVKNNIDASVFSVAFAMIAVVFILQNDEGIASSTPEGFQQPIELDLISTLARNQVSQSSLSDMRSNSAFDDMIPDTLQVNFHDDFSSSIEMVGGGEAMEAVAAEQVSMRSSTDQQSHVVKGKRTNRQSPKSPIPFVVSTNSTTGAHGGGLDSTNVIHDHKSVNNHANLSPASSAEDMANCLILLAQCQSGDSQAFNSDMPSTSSTGIERDDMFQPSNENQVNHVSGLRMRTNVTSKMTAATPQINHNDFSLNFFEEEDTINNNEEQEEYMNISKILEVICNPCEENLHLQKGWYIGN